MIASEKTIEWRLAVCKQCSEKLIKDGIERCGKCMCALAGKASIGKPTCPLNKWVV